MGKVTGFIEWQRALPKKRDKQDRLRDFNEFYLPQAPEQSRQQAGRCMDCGVPFCQQGCPLGNPIPDFNDAVYRDRWKAAFVQLNSTNNFPEFTGRLCPAPCEAACTLSINQPPVTIEQMEKEIIERAFAEGWVQPRPPATRTGCTVAVIGSGPAGLAAAVQLNQAGHKVTVFERDDRIGGLLRYGIPDFKMEKWVLDRRLAIMEADGIELRTSVDVGGKVSYAEIKSQYDAVLIATGARKARDLDVPGRELDGVVLAMDYLEAQNRVVAGDKPNAGKLDVKGKRVVILGGGDTGSDCLGTAHRQGAAEVTQIELLPAPPKERTVDNPWPQWPMVFRTSSSHEEGGARQFGMMTKKLEGEGGKLKALHTVKVELMKSPDGRTSLVEVPGSEAVLPCEVLLLAMGFTGPETEPLVAQLGVKVNKRGNVEVDRRFATSVPGVYAAGDASRGASLIVWAISEGREAARSIDQHLTGTQTLLPTKGADYPFGGR